MKSRGRKAPEQTREEIRQVAEALVRRVGYTKITVVGVAAELDMSAANVYRFFPSKAALISAICRHCLDELDRETSRIVVGTGTPQRRMETLFKTTLHFHKNIHLNERLIHDMLRFAYETNCDGIANHKSHIRLAVLQLLEQGVTAEVFLPHDSQHVSQIIADAMVCYWHPTLVAQNFYTQCEAELFAMTRLLMRSIEIIRTPFR